MGEGRGTSPGAESGRTPEPLRISAWIADGGACLADRVALAANFGTRLIGLLGRARLVRGEGLLLTPCRSVHSFLMRFAIDVVHLDDELRVVTAYTLPPNRAGPYVARGRHVLELPAGTCRELGVAPGQRVLLRRADGQPFTLARGRAGAHAGRSPFQ